MSTIHKQLPLIPRTLRFDISVLVRMSVLLVLLALSQASVASVTYIHTDHVGSVVMTTDAAGQVIKRHYYTPFGDEYQSLCLGGGLCIIGSEVNSPGYGGHMNSEHGLVYMQQRHYDPFLRRFMSGDPDVVDPRDPAIFNRYIYANNSPYTYNDPDGAIFKLLRIGVKVFKHKGNVKEGIREFGAEVVDSGLVLFDPTSSSLDKALAVFDLLSPISAKEVGSATRYAQRGFRSKKDLPDGGAFPDRPLPRNADGEVIPESDFPHTQLGTQQGRNGAYPQAREFDKDGKPVRDIDFTDHGRADHTNPHEHPFLENPTGGTRKRGIARDPFAKFR